MPENQESYGADNQFEEVDFEEIEDKLNGELDSGNQKPLFQTNTNASVEKVVLTRATNPKVDSRGREYYDLILKITCKAKQGNTEVLTTDNYGGLREYGDRFWSGNKSAFGKLRQKMRDEFGVETYKDMIRTLPGKDVKIKTEKTEFSGEQYQKNVIQSFL